MRSTAKRFVICLENEGYEVSLERRKVYQTLPDPDASKHRQIRVIDESGEDYLYPSGNFLAVELPPAVEGTLNSLTQSEDGLSLLRQARGMWKDRTDLPSLPDLRREWDRQTEPDKGDTTAD